LHISTLDLNIVKLALSYKTKILERNIIKNPKPTPLVNTPYTLSENTRIVKKISQKQTRLTSLQKDEIATKYKEGMSVTAIAKIYGCHHTTVGRILRKKGVENRKFTTH